MNYLLDSHVLLWSIFNRKNLTGAVREILRNEEHEVFVSAISFWEISLKCGLGKLSFEPFDPEDLPEICHQMRYKILPLASVEAATFHHLSANHHKDPFDRMLIHQAMRNRYILVSKDPSVHRYASEGLKVFWE